MVNAGVWNQRAQEYFGDTKLLYVHKRTVTPLIISLVNFKLKNYNEILTKVEKY